MRNAGSASDSDADEASASTAPSGSAPIESRRAQGPRQPAGADEQVLGGFRHLHLPEMGDAVGRGLALDFANVGDDAGPW